MASPHQGSETGVWSVEGHSIRVVYWTSVLEEIRAAAVAGYCKFPRGGLEVGGILFGRVEGGAIRIVAFRPVTCEYRFGPSFQLSENDHRAFADALRAPDTDPLLAGLEPVGWYHSHTRSGIHLSEHDVEVHDRHFPNPSHVALVVQPDSFGPSRAGFFFREPNGSIRTESSYSEFTLTARSRKQRGGTKEATTPEKTPARSEPRPALPEPERVAPKLPPPKAMEAKKAAPARALPLRRALWTAAALLTVSIAIATALLVGDREPPPTQSLALSALDLNGQLRIAWDKSAAPVLEATSGSLEIVDGDRRLVLPFNAAGLRRGSVTYARNSERVDVRLTVNPPGGSPVEEIVKFIGSRPAANSNQKAGPPQVQEDREVPEPKPPEPPSRGRRRGRQRTELSEPARPVERTRVLRLETVTPGPKFLNFGQPPALVPGAPPAPDSARLAFSRETLSAAPPPAPAQLSAAVKSGYRGPDSGRIIWTGQLGRGRSLSINGPAASTGYVNGELPGVPVRVSASPADLLGNGLIVYTARAVPAQSWREAPDPRNGWNVTRYAMDPYRAAQVLVTEPPSEKNGWRRLTLRSEDEPVAVVVIDWQVVK